MIVALFFHQTYCRFPVVFHASAKTILKAKSQKQGACSSRLGSALYATRLRRYREWLVLRPLLIVHCEERKKCKATHFCFLMLQATAMTEEIHSGVAVHV